MVRKNKNKLGKKKLREYYIIETETHNWSLGALVLGILLTLTEFVMFFEKPQISFYHGSIMVSNANMLMGVVVGTLFWAIIELLTPASKGIIHLWRPFVAYLFGFGLGTGLSAVCDFGGYLVVPAMNGNPYALFELVMMFVITLIMIWNAVWSHDRTLVGSFKPGKANQKKIKGESGK